MKSASTATRPIVPSGPASSANRSPSVPSAFGLSTTSTFGGAASAPPRLDRVAELGDLLGCARDRADRPAQLAQLLADDRPVLGDVGRELRGLATDDPADPAEERRDQETHHDDGGRAPDPPALDAIDQRRERERDEHRQRERHQHRLAEVEDGDHHDRGDELREIDGAPAGDDLGTQSAAPVMTPL
jgi:hypothetical protein